MLHRLAGLPGDRSGVTAVEYGLIMALVVLVMLVGLHNFANVTVGIWNDLATKVGNA